MRINFVLPGIGLSGGSKVVFELSNRLQNRGHQVKIIYPIAPPRYGKNFFDSFYLRFRGIAGNIIRGNKVDWFPLKVPVIRVPFLSNRFVPDADVIFATAWPTAYQVDRLNKSKGKKFYFIQHYEIWQAPRELVDKSYKLHLKKIVIASWLRDLMKDKFDENIVGIVNPAINLNEFYNENKKFNKNKRILMMYHEYEWKGCKDGIKAFEIAKKKHPEIKLVLFATKKFDGIPLYAEFHLRPYGDALRKIYCSCDIFLAPSHSEGFYLPPLEAMACKCAVVATNVGCIPDIVELNNAALLVSAPKNPEMLATNLLSLIDDEEKLKKVSFAGYDTVKNFTWEKSVEKFISIIKNEII